jgi:perosamine synthetase
MTPVEPHVSSLSGRHPERSRGIGTRTITLSSPDITEREVHHLTSVLATPRLSIGPYLEAFERKIAEFVGAKEAIGVSSGTAGLHLAVIAAGLGEGDEVITSPFSFVASANCLLFERARPVFVDIEPRTLTLDPERLEAAITPKTKAILPVHVFGHPCDLDAVMRVASRHRLTVIEDACEALGSAWRTSPDAWKMAGTFGQTGVFAFYPNKQVTTGEGGMIVTDDSKIAALCRSLRNQGRAQREPDGTRFVHERLGYNYRLSEINAAIGLGQMERIEELLSKRAQVAAWYAERIAKVPGVTCQPVDSRARMSWFVYVVRLQAELVRRHPRARLMAALAERGVPTADYFPPIHLQPLYRERFGHREGQFPVTEEVSARTLALPFHGKLTEDDVDYVCDQLNEVLHG